MRRSLRNIRCIHWFKETSVINLNHDEFVNKIDELKNKGYTEIRLNGIISEYAFRKTYSTKQSGDYLNLCLVENDKLTRYQTNWLDDNKNKSEMSGTEAVRLLINKFKEINNIDSQKAFTLAFGTTKEEFKRNVPKQFSFLNEKYKDGKHIYSSIDISSSYPACIRGRLPNANTAITVKGRVSPNEEYPFAFYKSGHLAEYNVFDTHDWLGHRYFISSLFRYKARKEAWPLLNLKDDEEETILMKASDYKLDDVINYFYSIKESYPEGSKEYIEAKGVMNRAIGTLHQQVYTSYKYAHLAAIAIGRSTNKILNKCNEIGCQYIAHICVDGIIYLGPEKYGSDIKALGEFKQEFTNVEGKISHINVYIMMNGAKLVKVRHGAFTHFTDYRPITDDNIKSLDDQYQWIRINKIDELRRSLQNG